MVSFAVLWYDITPTHTYTPASIRTRSQAYSTRLSEIKREIMLTLNNSLCALPAHFSW